MSNNTSSILFDETHASIGIGSLIIFIAMILISGLTASVIFQTMTSMQEQTLKTGQETLREVASGLRVTDVCGYVQNSIITQLAIFVQTTAGSEAIDFSQTHLVLSDSQNQVLLNYDSNCFNDSVTNGLFNTLNASNLTSGTFGLIVIRDIDTSCSSDNPAINQDDLIVILVNTTQCFSGIDTRTKVSGRVIPELGMRGVIAFTTPTSFVDTIIDLS